MRWSALVPLIGGQVFGTASVLLTLPEVFVSYPEFARNERWLHDFMPDIRRRHITDEGDRDWRRWFGRPDLVVSTCPCAGLSMLSPHKADSPHRASLNAYMVKTTELVLAEVRPRLLLGENAPQLATRMGAGVRASLALAGARHGYGLTVLKVSSTLAGLPQHRERSFYVFTRGGTPGVDAVQAACEAESALFPHPIERVIVGTAHPDDEDLPFTLAADPLYADVRRRWGSRWRTGGGKNKVYSDPLHMLIDQGLVTDFCAWWTDDVTERFCGPLSHLDAQSARGQVRMMRRLVRKKEESLHLGVYAQPPILPRRGCYPALTAKTTERLVHPVEERYLTYREAARLMGLPDELRLPPVKEFNLVCQNVPVPTAAWATRVALRLDEAPRLKAASPVLWDALRGRELRDLPPPARPPAPIEARDLAPA